MSYLAYPFMQRALIAAVLVGLCAPAVGTYLVQKRLSLMGDGIGHVAFAGVGLGILLGTSPVLVAVVVSAAGAVAMEIMRSRAKTSGDMALAILFYGGIATGALLISINGDSSINVQSYLFGSILTVNNNDIIVTAVLAAFVLLVTIGLRRALFATSHDEEFARVSGVPVMLLNILLAITAAVTVSVAMRVVGLLLVSALLVLPVASAQQLTGSFASTFATAIGIGVVVTLAGVVLAYPVNVGPGSLIVVVAIGVFFLCALASRARERLFRRRHAIDATTESVAQAT